MSPNAIRPDGMTALMITVMTLNIGNGLASSDRLVHAIQGCGADIVGLQEVDERQATVIRNELAGTYPFQILHGTGFSGRGLLSTFPIIDHDMIQLRSGPQDLRARLTIRSIELTAIVAHPLPPRLTARGVVADPESAGHVQGLLALALETAPAIILGDFNMTPRNPLYRQMQEAGLVDAFQAAGRGRGLTFPMRPGKMRSINHRMHWLPLLPVSRIDYIWHTPEIATIDSWVGPNAGSDHLPVLARLQMPGHAKLNR